MRKMSFNIESIKTIITRLNSYLMNACAVQTLEMSSANKAIKQIREERTETERRVSEECSKRVDQLAKNTEDAIKADEDFVDNIVQLNAKLSSIDKKYAKRDRAITFAGISESLRQDILVNIGYHNSIFDEDIVGKLYDFYKTNSYRFISKPISPLIIATKKRKNIYDQLACSVIMAQEYCKVNKQLYTDRRDEDIKTIKEETAQQILNLRKRYAIKLAVLQQQAQTDNVFLVEESRKSLSDIFSEEFYTSYHSIRDKAEKCFRQLNEDASYNDEIYIGDIAYRLSDVILSNPIGKDFIANNKALFEDEVFFMPWTMSIRNCQSVFITPNSSSDKERAVAFVNQYIYSFLRQLPLNGLELTIIDPEIKGNSVLPFLNVHALIPDMFSKKIYTSMEDIASRISELDQYVDSVIQQKLSNKFDNVFEYNAATPDSPLSIKLICIFDFPKFFEERTYESLLSIIKNANRCGIFVVICYSPGEQKNSYGDIVTIIQEIKESSVCFLQSKGLLCLENTPLVVLPVELPKQAVLDDYCIEYERAYKKKLSQGIPFISVVKEGDFFTKKSAEYLAIPVGKGDGSATQFIEFGKRSSQHAIITGATGSGKSTLLHTLIMSAIINYSPDELNLYLMDFKSGTEFKIYETIKVPHIKLLALDALQEFGESILMELVEEQNRRSQLFKDNGDHTSIKSFVSATGQAMPRILVVMDEFQILFNDSSNRKVALHCAELANKIVTEGRAFGIHLIMATQTLRSIREKTALSNSTIEQMRIRMGLKCGEEDANYIFGDANARDALQKMKGAIGTAVYNPEFTEAGNCGFRVSYCPESEQKDLLASIQEACKGKWEITTKVFEGKRIPEFPVDLIEKYKDVSPSELIFEIGEPIRVDEPVKVIFQKKKNNNLLIVGSDNTLMSRIVSLISLEAALPNDVVLHYVDGNAFFDEPIEPFISVMMKKGLSVNLVSSRKECLLTIERLYDEFKKRRKSLSLSTDKHITIINGLQYVDILCSMLKGDYINRNDYIESNSEDNIVEGGGLDLGEFGHAESDEIEYSVAIKELIEFGYSYGLYFVIACNEYQTVRDVLHYGAGLLGKLSNRIIFAISDKDSDDLIDGIQVSGMNHITAVYTDGIKKVMQFKPYSIPTLEIW